MDIILTRKQQLFCDEFLVDMNATRAALRAGYSATTALNGALMRLPKIKAYLYGRYEERAGKIYIDREMLLRELSIIAFGSIGNYYGDDGEPKALYMLTEDEKAAIAYMKTDNAGVLTIKMNNKLSALKEIAKLMRFYEPNVDEPRPKYVYLDKEHLDADDKFEDDSFEENQESVDENQDSRAKNQDLVTPTNTDEGKENQESRGENQDIVTPTNADECKENQELRCMNQDVCITTSEKELSVKIQKPKGVNDGRSVNFGEECELHEIAYRL